MREDCSKRQGRSTRTDDAAAARPIVTPWTCNASVNSRPSLVSCRSLHFLEHSARRRACSLHRLPLPSDNSFSCFTSHFRTLQFKFPYYAMVDFASLGCFSYDNTIKIPDWQFDTSLTIVREYVFYVCFKIQKTRLFTFFWSIISKKRKKRR